MNSDKDVLFFTCALGFHENFVIPYTFFAKKSNKNAKFEYIVEDVEKFVEKNKNSIDWLRDNLDVEIELRSTDEVVDRPKLKNSFRFVLEPLTKAEFVYIGDVDIMILEDVYEKHKQVFESGLPYSNVIRGGSNKLTGLHFVKFSEFYPLPSISDLVSKIQNDEELLYAITERKGILYQNEVKDKVLPGRPVHGVHMSLNRLPLSYDRERVGWGIQFWHMKKLKEIMDSKSFVSFYESLYPGASSVIANLKVLSEGAVHLGEEFWSDKQLNP